MLLLCGAGLALALLGIVLLRVRGLAGLPPPGLEGLGFVLLLVGYGALAGLAPLYTWLPRAMAVSPAPVAVMLAGLLLPAALHALFRFAASAGAPGATGLLAAVGMATALLAAAAAWRRAFPARALPGWGAAGSGDWPRSASGSAARPATSRACCCCSPCRSPSARRCSARRWAVRSPGSAAWRSPGCRPSRPLWRCFCCFPRSRRCRRDWRCPSARRFSWPRRPSLARRPGRRARRRRAAGVGRRRGAGRGGLLVVAPPWLLLFFALALGAMLPERVAAALAEAARLVR